MADTNVVEMLSGLKASFVPDRSAGINASIQLKLVGEPSGEAYVWIHDKQIEIQPGKVEKPKLTITGSAKDLADIFTGKMDGASAYMMGRIGIVGDLSLAMRLESLFRR